jgi:hypothetical protein
MLAGSGQQAGKSSVQVWTCPPPSSEVKSLHDKEYLAIFLQIPEFMTRKNNAPPTNKRGNGN